MPLSFFYLRCSYYRVNKVNFWKEFFNIDLATIESLVGEYHGNIYLNYTSEALHFRESLRLSEKTINL